jgi:hypothetical protein
VRSLLPATVVLSLAIPLVGCSSTSYMGLSECRGSDCYNFRRGLTKEQFVGSHARPYHSTAEYRQGDDVWEVWVFTLGSDAAAFGIPEGGPAREATYASLPSYHQEYVAFKNGLLDEWGWGTLPRALRHNQNREALRTSAR